MLPTPFVEPSLPPPSVIELGSTSGSKDVVIFEDSGFAISLLLKTLEEIKVENAVVREMIDKQDEILKVEAGINTKIEEMLEAILSRLPSS